MSARSSRRSSEVPVLFPEETALLPCLPLTSHFCFSPRLVHESLAFFTKRFHCRYGESIPRQPPYKGTTMCTINRPLSESEVAEKLPRWSSGQPVLSTKITSWWGSNVVPVPALSPRKSVSIASASSRVPISVFTLSRSPWSFTGILVSTITGLFHTKNKLQQPRIKLTITFSTLSSRLCKHYHGGLQHITAAAVVAGLERVTATEIICLFSTGHYVWGIQISFSVEATLQAVSSWPGYCILQFTSTTES